MTTALKLLNGGISCEEGTVATPVQLHWSSDTRAIINDVKNGKMCVLINDGDEACGAVFFVPAQMATPEAISFMACHGRGLVCLALTPSRVAKLGLERLPTRNGGSAHADFTVSIEARTGVTTGISAFDRARTIAVAIGAEDADELVSPGHVFPVVSEAGGVFKKLRCIEAVVDFSRLAGLNESAVFCSILGADGGIARTDEVVRLAQVHGLKIGLLSDLIRFRVEQDRDVVELTSNVRTANDGERRAVAVYRHCSSGAEALVLFRPTANIKGLPVYIQRRDQGGLVDEDDQKSHERAIENLKRLGGVVILLDRSFSQEQSFDPSSYQVAVAFVAQILADLGIFNIQLFDGSLLCPADFEKFGISASRSVEKLRLEVSISAKN